MDYKKFLSTTSTKFSVNDHLIEHGNTTWQIRNIASASVKRRAIAVNEPEPTFNEARPSGTTNWSVVGWTFVIIWGYIGIGQTSPYLGFFLAAFIAGVMIYYFEVVDAPSTSGWEQQRKDFERRKLVWAALKKNPPVVYSLMLETNAGSKPLFYSLDERQISETLVAIKAAMAQKASTGVHFAIDTINVGGDDSINNFDSEIVRQTLAKASP